MSSQDQTVLLEDMDAINLGLLHLKELSHLMHPLAEFSKNIKDIIYIMREPSISKTVQLQDFGGYSQDLMMVNSEWQGFDHINQPIILQIIKYITLII